MTDTKLKPEFSVVILGSLVLMLFAELFGWDTVRLVGALTMLGTEAWALGRKLPGDTVTEHAKRFYGKKPARIPLVLGFSAYLPITMIQTAVEPDIAWHGIPLGVLVLAAAFGSWLPFHFLFDDVG